MIFHEELPRLAVVMVHTLVANIIFLAAFGKPTVV